MGKNSRTIINVICSICSLGTSLVISFFLSPFIVQNIGIEANGFVTLASNFIVYAQLIVTALNSMAGRFITIAYVQKDYKKANLYYNSVFWGNLIIVAVLIIPAGYFISCMERIINVPSEIVLDVKLLFTFVFLNFFLTTGLPNWDCGTFVTNRLDRVYIPDIGMQVLRCAVLFSMMTFLVPHVWYVGMTSSICTIVLLAIKGYNTHTLTPQLRISFGKKGRIICSWKAIQELVGSGIWNSISNVGNMLLSGLDLIICNLFIGPTEMGVVALSKTLPNLMQQLSSSIRGAFAPELTINYAKGDKQAVLRDLKRAMKLTSFVMTIPIGGIVVLGDRFFALWVPSQDAQLLQTLSILAILGYMFTSGTQILYNVFSTVNKVKENSIAMLLSGVASTSITLALIRFTDLDIYAVAGVSTFVNLTRNMTFTLPATARYLGFRWNQFFPQVGSTILASGIIVLVGLAVKALIPQGGWIMFFIAAGVVGILGGVINYFMILNREERQLLTGKVLKRFRRC